MVDNTILFQYLNDQMPGMLQTLSEMVRINSFTCNRDGVCELGGYTAGCFERLGFKAGFISCTNTDFGDHLFLTRCGKSSKSIKLVSHLDTVYPPEEEVEKDFTWRESGDFIYGPGVVDIKGGTVMILLCLLAIKEFEPDLFEEISWDICLNAAEEVLTPDFTDIMLARCQTGKTLGCLVFEGSTIEDGNFRIINSRKGRAKFGIDVTGKAAHAGANHHEGANAIVQLSHVIHEVAELTDYEHDLTFNVGMISGGPCVNRVPHYASAQFEMRAFSEDIFEQGVKEVMKLNKLCTVSSSAHGHPCDVEITLDDSTEPWVVNEKTESLLELWSEAASSLELKVEPEARGGLSDGNCLFNDYPTIDGLGPVGGNAHCSESSEDGTKVPEYIIKSLFVPKAAINIVAIMKLLEK